MEAAAEYRPCYTRSPATEPGQEPRRASGVPPPLVVRQGLRASPAEVRVSGESAHGARGYTAT